MKKRIILASDHAGFKLKECIKNYLLKKRKNILDLGTENTDSVDYPDYAHTLSKKIVTGEVEKGILICGTGIGISIAANKNKGIRAALCCSEYHAEMSRQHNDANIISFGARVTNVKDMFRMIDIFLNTKFNAGRHKKRVEKIENNE